MNKVTPFTRFCAWVFVVMFFPVFIIYGIIFFIKYKIAELRADKTWGYPEKESEWL
ncbi:MAG: hypothetical protein GY928_24285 [Colwellia sp.]|nr:hypothetical protein [Colwellia sp.]